MFASLNQDILLAFYHLGTSAPFVSDVVIFFAEWFPALVIASVVVYECYTQTNEKEITRIILRTAFPSLLVWLLVATIKFTFPSPRPFVSGLGIIPLISVSDPFGSFPSAHAAVFGALAGTMFANKFHAWKWYLLGAVLIALARVAAGVHFPIDVGVGILLGIVVGFSVSKLLLLRKK